MTNNQQHPASFRDPAGFIFEQDGKFYRQVNQVYAADYDLLLKSGLYDVLVNQKKLIPHTEIAGNLTGTPGWYKTLLPEQLDMITYPYEWCFSQWKDAALLTLDLVRTAMAHGMIVKDATPFNVQFVKGAPLFIDTLSFEKYDAAKPWVAYRQFIECFLVPLLMAKYNTPSMLQLFQLYPDGIPLPVATQLLPFKSKLNGTVFLHITLPGLLGNGKSNSAKKETAFTQQKLQHIISNLHSFISALALPARVTQWNNYYEATILSDAYVEAKMAIVQRWLANNDFQAVLDIGANTGLFALAAAAAGKHTVAIDADAACIDNLYTVCRQKKISNLVPLVVDITHPTPAIGWDNQERAAFPPRIQTGCTLALAVVHHLAIGKNISFQQMAVLFSRFSKYLVIEFVPKDDPKVHLLLKNRKDIFMNYTEADFLRSFEAKFTVISRIAVPESSRILFLMKR